MIRYKSADEIEQIRKASVIVVRVLDSIRRVLAPGMTTLALDKLAVDVINDYGAKSAFNGYRGYPKNICTSINEELIHGIPGPRVVKDGDIISIDVGVELNGFFGDATVTLGVGKISKELKRLIAVTERALYKAIDKAVCGNRLSDISCTIQEEVERNNLFVVREFVGHGIGFDLHEDPQVLNFGQPHMGPELKKGMVLALEPMVNIGGSEVEILPDGWTAINATRKPSAHFEHTVAITEKGPKILTKI